MYWLTVGFDDDFVLLLRAFIKLGLYVIYDIFVYLFKSNFANVIMEPI